MSDTSPTDIAVDSNGNVIVVWYEGNVQANRFSAATGTWSGPVVVAANLMQVVSSDPKVAIDADGNAIVVWVQVPPGTGNRRVFAAHGTGATWSPAVSLMTDPNAYTTEPAVIAVNAGGEAMAVWQQLTDSPATLGIWARGYR